MWSNQIIRSQVNEVSFGFYGDEELKALSVCKVTSPVTKDSLGIPLPG